MGARRDDAGVCRLSCSFHPHQAPPSLPQLRTEPSGHTAVWPPNPLVSLIARNTTGQGVLWQVHVTLLQHRGAGLFRARSRVRRLLQGPADQGALAQGPASAAQLMREGPRKCWWRGCAHSNLNATHVYPNRVRGPRPHVGVMRAPRASSPMPGALSELLFFLPRHSPESCVAGQQEEIGRFPRCHRLFPHLPTHGA